MRTERRFRAVLERGERALGGTVARVPFDPHAVWPGMARLRVCGSVSGPMGTEAFRTSLFSEPGGRGFFLLVNRAVQRGAGVGLAGGAG